MLIELKKFGTVLTSRQSGKESYSAILPVLNNKQDKNIEIDFTGVLSLSPSWADEFFVVGLLNEYGADLLFRQSDNLSVKASLDILEKSNNIKFNYI
jgi:hypothetical protein